MKLMLPEVLPFHQFCKHEDGWSDHYGALQTAAAYAGCTLPARYFVRSIWMHGCFGPWEATSPGALVFNAPGAKRQRIFVARQEEADYLKDHGHDRARAIGLPILYTPPSGLARAPRSLLVMPTHSLTGDEFPDRSAFERYADEIAAIAPQFDHVSVCVHPSCRQNGLWIKEFTERGLHLIDGAQASDRNALFRMRALFEQFETVTSNGWGSHIAYALAFGARVSIHGTRPALNVENLKRDTSWAVNLATLDLALAPETQDQERAFLRDFAVPPHEAIARQALGAWLLGASHKLTPEAMREVLPEIVDPVIEVAGAGTTRRPRRRILFAAPHAEPTSATLAQLEWLRWLRRETDVEFDVYLHRLGPAAEEFVKVAAVFTPQTLAELKDRLPRYDAIEADGITLARVMEELGGVNLPIVTRLSERLEDNVDGRLLGVALRHSRAILPLSPDIAASVTGLVGETAALVPVQLPLLDLVPLDEAGTNTTALRERLRIPAGARIIGGFADCWAAGGADLFIQVAAHIRRTSGNDIHFLWSGPSGDEAGRRLLRGDLQRLGLADHVHLLDEPLSPALVALADVWAVPARQDPVPLATLLTAGLGRPIVTFTGNSTIESIIAAGGGTAVPFLDTTRFGDACLALLQDPAAARLAGERAQAVVRSRHDVAEHGRLHLETLLAAAGRPASAPMLGELYARWPQSLVARIPGAAAQINRAAARRDAQALVQAGRRNEAVQRLIRAAKADIATNDPVVVIEGLVEIGDDLDALEPKQSAFLLGEAERIAHGAGRQLSELRLSRLPAVEPAGPLLRRLSARLGVAATDAVTTATATTAALLRRLDELPPQPEVEPYEAKSPVAMLVFNRPDHTRRVFAAIRAARPKQLFLVADGPRGNRPNDALLCQQVRMIVSQVDWPCDVSTNFAEINLGCTERVVSGLDWVFEHVERCIILEDDCLPSPEFFRFCDEMLARHEANPRISCITGNSFQFGLPRSPHGSFCTPHILIWGWATWRRAWRHYDRGMTRWPELRATRFLDEIVGSGPVKAFWTRLFDAAHAGRTAWDLPWVFSCWAQKGLGICPAADLIQNIGFDEQATGNIANVHPIFQRLYGNFPIGRMDTSVTAASTPAVNDAAFRFIQKAHYEQDWAQVRRDLAVQWLTLDDRGLQAMVARVGRDGLRRILDSGLAELPVTELDASLAKRCEVLLQGAGEPSLTQLLAAALFAGRPRATLPPLATAA